MSRENEHIDRVWELAEKYAGLKQFSEDVLNRLGSYTEDQKKFKDETNAELKKLTDIMHNLELGQKDSLLEQQKQIERLVEGMNKKIENVENKAENANNEIKFAKRQGHIFASIVAAIVGVIGWFINNIKSLMQ